MKHLRIIFLYLALAVAPLGVIITGCGSTPNTKTTKVVGTVTTTVDAAMNGWGAYVRSGKATIEQRNDVRNAYLKYQAAMRIAEQATVTALSNTNAPSYQVALNAASAASVDLIALIESFTQKK